MPDQYKVLAMVDKMLTEAEEAQGFNEDAQPFAFFFGIERAPEAGGFADDTNARAAARFFAVEHHLRAIPNYSGGVAKLYAQDSAGAWYPCAAWVCFGLAHWEYLGEDHAVDARIP